MNGKVIFGSDFTDCLQYVLGKDKAQLLDTNLLGTSVLEFAAEFRLVASSSERIVKPVMHLSLSPHPNDVLDNQKKSLFTQKLLAELGMSNCQYLIAEHQDTATPEGQPRPHLHVIANRIPLDQNKAVNSSWIKRRVEKALQKLREEFDLQPVVASWEVERSAPSTGQMRRYRREQQEYEQGMRSRKDPLCSARPPQLPVKVQLQDAIDLATKNHPTLPELILDLQRQGIQTRVYFPQSSAEKQAIGISYRKDGIAFRGTKLGKAYSLPGLQQYRNVTYQPLEDNQLIEQLMEHSLDSMNNMTIDDSPTMLESSINVEKASWPHPEKQQQQTPEQVISVILELLNHYDTDELDNGHYQIHRLEKGQQILLNRSDSLFSILGFNWENGKAKVWSNQLQPEDEAYFGAIADTFKEMESNQPVNEDSEDWQQTREQLQLDYAIPCALSQVLYEQGQLAINAQGEATFVKQPIEDVDNALFWFSTGENQKRAVITENPIEAVSAFLVEDAQSIAQATVYLAIETNDEIPTQFLNQFNEVLISSENRPLCEQLTKLVPKVQSVTLIGGSWNQTWQSQQQSTKQQNRHSLEVSRQRQLQL